MTTLISSFIALRDGPTLPEAAVLLGLTLESRGHVLGTADGKLTVSDGSTLTTEDRAAITRWRLHLMALVAYSQEGHKPR